MLRNLAIFRLIRFCLSSSVSSVISLPFLSFFEEGISLHFNEESCTVIGFDRQAKCQDRSRKLLLLQMSHLHVISLESSKLFLTVIGRRIQLLRRGACIKVVLRVSSHKLHRSWVTDRGPRGHHGTSIRTGTTMTWNKKNIFLFRIPKEISDFNLVDAWSKYFLFWYFRRMYLIPLSIYYVGLWYLYTFDLL